MVMQSVSMCDKVRVCQRLSALSLHKPLGCLVRKMQHPPMRMVMAVPYCAGRRVNPRSKCRSSRTSCNRRVLPTTDGRQRLYRNGDERVHTFVLIICETGLYVKYDVPFMMAPPVLAIQQRQQESQTITQKRPRSTSTTIKPTLVNV